MNLPGREFQNLTPKEKIVCKEILINEINFLDRRIEIVEVPYKAMKEYLKNRKRYEKE